MQKPSKETYSKPETAQRMETALRAALAMPPKPHAEMRLGKPKANKAASPIKKRRAATKDG
jgi:hypothetical protein